MGDTKRTVLEVLDELGQLVDTSETPRDVAVLALGCVLGIALRAGWSIQEIIALRAWPSRLAPTRCGQVVSGEQCPCVASYRYTWPGRPEAFICGDHVGKLRSVAAGMGLELEIIELI